MESIQTVIKEELQLIPENGSIVIIDDQANEALPIIKALSKKGIATTYYQGYVKDDLPAAPLQSIRLLFLDLQIIESSDEHQIANTVLNVLLRIVSKDNGPYLLVIWSKKKNTYLEAVKKEIYKYKHLIPACIIQLEKEACLERKLIPSIEPDLFIERLKELLEGSIHADDIDVVEKAVISTLSEESRIEFEAKVNAVEIIEHQLKTELEKVGVFHLFVIWENIVKKSAAKMVSEVSSLINNDEYWETNTRNVLKRMGVSRIGRNKVAEEILIRESINTLNISLVDNIEHEIKGFKIPDSITLQSEIVYVEKTDTGDFAFRSVQTESEIFKNKVSIKKDKEKAGLKKGITNERKINAEDKISALKLLENYDLLPASLNTKLHIELNPSQELTPGNIYLNLEQKKKEQYIKSFLKETKGPVNEYFLIDLEVSPICDFAQQKWKRSRTLPGLMYPAKYFDNIKSGANIYPVMPSFVINQVEYKFIFDYHLFHAWDKDSAKARKVYYRFKRELLLDIIAQLASHVNRPGISFIE